MRSACENQIKADGRMARKPRTVEVRLLDYTTGRRRTMAVFRLAPDGRVVIQGHVPKGFEDDLASLSHWVVSGRDFLRQLPREFTGSYLRAMLRD